MKTFYLLRHVEKQGLDNSEFNCFTMPGIGTATDFVKRYFGGSFVSGTLERGQHYVAFWGEANKPDEDADAVITDDSGYEIFIYRAE